MNVQAMGQNRLILSFFRILHVGPEIRLRTTFYCASGLFFKVLFSLRQHQINPHRILIYLMLPHAISILIIPRLAVVLIITSRVSSS